MKIHNHPQLPEYTDQSQWPFISAQGHWKLHEGHIAHTHIEPTIPIYAELTGNQFIVPVQFQLFHVDGKLSQISSDHGAFVLDNTGQWMEYVNIPGDPHGVVIIKGKFYVNPLQSDSNPAKAFPRHGWGGIVLNASTVFNNGDSTKTSLRIPFFSMIDPTQPEVPDVGDGFGPLLRAECAPLSPKDPILNAWGALISEFHLDKIPILAPINTSWNPTLGLTTYAGQPGLEDSGEIRKDMNLHEGIPGVNLPLSPTFNPAMIGEGTHKLGFIWDQKSGPNGVPGVFGPNEEAAVLLVVNVIVGNVIPGPDPEPVCSVPVNVSSTVNTTAWQVVGDHQERTITTITLQSRVCK